MSDTPRTDQYVTMRASLAYCVEKDTADFARQLERELAEVTKQRDALVGALVSMKQTEPANHNGDLFYPRHSPDGDYLGEEPIDPIALLGGLYTMINEALASMKGGEL